MLSKYELEFASSDKHIPIQSQFRDQAHCEYPSVTGRDEASRRFLCERVDAADPTYLVPVRRLEGDNSYSHTPSLVNICLS